MKKHEPKKEAGEENLQQKQSQEKTYAHLALLLASAIFAGYNIVARVAASKGINPILFIALRAMITWLCLSAITWVSEGNVLQLPRAQHQRKFFFLAAINLSVQMTYLGGMMMTSATIAGVMQCVGPVVGVLLGVWMGVESITWQKVVATILAGKGVVAMVWASSSGSGPTQSVSMEFIMGTLLFVLEAVVLSYGTIRQKEIVHSYSALACVRHTAGAVACLGTVLVAINVFVQGPEILELQSSAVIALLYAAILSGSMGYCLKAFANRYLEMSAVQLYQPMQSVFTVLAAVLLLDEPLTPIGVVGMGMVISAMAIAIFSKQKPLPRAKDEEAPTDI